MQTRKITSTKAKQIGGYVILFIFLLIPLPFSYMAVSDYSEGSILQQKIKELHRLTIELSYILNRHIMMEEDDLEDAYQEAKKKYSGMVINIRGGPKVSLPQRESALMATFVKLDERWEGFINTLDSAMDAGDELVISRREVEYATLPLINAIHGLVVAFEETEDTAYNKSINLSGLERMLTMKMSYAMERYISNWKKWIAGGEGDPRDIMKVFEDVLGGLRGGSDDLGLKAVHDPMIISKLDSIDRLWAVRKKHFLAALDRRDEYKGLIQSIEGTYQPLLEESLVDMTNWLAVYDQACLRRIVISLISTIVASLVFIGWSFWLSNRFTWRPIRELKSAISSFESERDIKALSVGRNDEVGELARMFYKVLKGRLNEVERLVRFGNLINDEISEKECYNILIKFLTATFKIDRIVAVSFNNSENFSEVVASYERTSGEMSLSANTSHELSAIKDPQLCRVVRSGLKFINNDVNEEYRCPDQEVVQSEGSCGCYPVSVGGAVLGWIHMASSRTSFFTDKDTFIINSYIGYMAPAISSIRLINAHRKLAVKDPLTGLYNRRYLEETLERNIAISCRYNQPLSVLMIDVDHFKRFNDLFGHSHGDKVLQTIANIMNDNARGTDVVARYGGEEFTIVMPSTDKEGAFVVAERIRKDIEENAVTTIKGSNEKVTISLGIATCPDDTVEKDELVKLADAALYQSKAAGRNRITLASHEALKEIPGNEMGTQNAVDAE